MTTGTKLRFAAGFVAGALALAVCGDSGGSPTTAAPPATELPPATTGPPPTTAPPTTLPAPTTAPPTTAPPTTTTTVPPPPKVTLAVDGFPVLENGFHYEVWSLPDGPVLSLGQFNVTADGALVTPGGDPIDGFAFEATPIMVAVTIEPPGDDDGLPSDTHFVGGTVAADGTAELTTRHPTGLKIDFADVSGRLVLATPSTATKDDELSGIWFLTLPGSVPGLDLPELPAGWKYEGWAVVDGVPLTSGKFTDVAAADESFPFGGPGRMPDRPGEDYVANAPPGVTLPTDLSGQTVFVSVEPDPDDSASPFVIQPLVTVLPDPAEEEPVAYDLVLDLAGLPTAIATIG